LHQLLQKSGAVTSGISGTIWSGEARTVSCRAAALEPAALAVRSLAIAARRAGCAYRGDELPDGFFSGHVSRSLGGRLVLRDIEAAAPLNALSPGMASMTGNSQLSIRMQEIAWLDGWVETAIGTVQLSEVVLPIPVLAGRTPPGNYVHQLRQRVACRRCAARRKSHRRRRSPGDQRAAQPESTAQLRTVRHGEGA
jgi:hypothetical protein